MRDGRLIVKQDSALSCQEGFENVRRNMLFTGCSSNDLRIRCVACCNATLVYA